MNNTFSFGKVAGWAFGLLVFTIGVLNLFLVHPVPGIVYMLLAFVFFPFTNVFLRKQFGFAIPLVVRIVLGVFIMWFTLGVSDLAEMYHI